MANSKAKLRKLNLVLNRKYQMKIDGRKLMIKVVSVYDDFYLVRVNGKYNTTISKYNDESNIIV